MIALLHIIGASRTDPMFYGNYYEFCAIIVNLLALAHCWHMRGRWDTLKIFGIGMFYGLVLENGGPMEFPDLGFEGYFWEDNYNLYLFEFFGHGHRFSAVPIATHLGWSMVFYTAVLFWEQICKAWPKLKEHVFLSAFVITLSGLLFDLPFDILATRFHWWVWNERFLNVWFGVPLVNYLAWFWAVGTFGWFWVWFHNKEGWDDKKIAFYLFLCMPWFWVIDGIGFNTTKFLADLAGWIYL